MSTRVLPNAVSRGRGGGRKTETRPTHSLPLVSDPFFSPQPDTVNVYGKHNHSTLRTRVQSFQNGLLNSSIPGVDPSIVIDPRRLHFTLGVMALGSKTVEDALGLLNTLRPSIVEILNGASAVKVRLDTMDVFKSNNMDANVLFLGPTLGDSEEDVRLWNVCNLINQSFRYSGFVTETRPLKLHCTILNTSHRRPRNIPFSYSDILASLNMLGTSPSHATTARTVDFGTYDVGRVELWEMASHGPNNEYVSCGGIEF